jgi:hypothetical protein
MCFSNTGFVVVVSEGKKNWVFLDVWVISFFSEKQGCEKCYSR